MFSPKTWIATREFTPCPALAISSTGRLLSSHAFPMIVRSRPCPVHGYSVLCFSQPELTIATNTNTLNSASLTSSAVPYTGATMRDRDEDVIMSSNVEDFNNIALSQLPESCQNKPSQTRKKKKRKNKKASLVQQPPKSKSASKVSKSRKRRLARRAMGLTLQQKMAAPQIGESLPTGWTASSIAGCLEEPSKPRQEFRDRCMRTIVPPKDSAKESPSMSTPSPSFLLLCTVSESTVLIHNDRHWQSIEVGGNCLEGDSSSAKSAAACHRASLERPRS